MLPARRYQQLKLTATAIKNAQPREKQYSMVDGGGLYLLVKPNGGKYWRYKYRHNGKQKTLAIGTFPKLSLKDARTVHQEARRQIVEGIDPTYQRQLDKALKVEQAQNSFQAVALEWLNKQKPILGAESISKCRRSSAQLSV